MSHSQGHGAALWLVIPCYNEERRLRPDAFGDFLAAHETVQILFVDDGSRDSTRRVLTQISQGSDGRAGILALERNRGKAEAVRSGVEYVLRHFDPEIVGFWDADLATPLAAVDKFLDVFELRPEVLMVFGARVKLLGRHVERRALRHYLGRVFATTVSSMLRLPIYDTQCGAKMFRVDEAARVAFAEQFLSKWVFDVEILARYLKFFQGDTHKLEQAIYEYPLEQWVDVAGSKVHAGDFFKALLDIVRIKRKYL
jgi:dolichyl-phosphate beta-glucosyltransferase